MQEIAYQSEHLLPGMVGKALVIIAFLAALFSFTQYTLFFKRNWRNSLTPARVGFYLHAGAVMGMCVLLLWMLQSGYYEYDYVWKHANDQMPSRYLFAAFWEGQEGSFLLWMFWQCLIGFVLIRKAGDWEGPVMLVIALAQLFLASMLLGVFVGELRIGSNPFLLMREMPGNIGLPWTELPDYLTRVPQFSDGRGLNPLLQNYWMTIHPPTLFLGFSLVLVPFAYALAGLWKKESHGWMRPARPWAFLGVAVLGLGILMGGAWAYEALSFGGFWAWDPVENASLVPWLLLVGAAHLMLLNRQRPKSVYTSLLITFAAFITVLYSTFLTRSGILGDTSVHSFTDNGMIGQLLVYLLFFSGLFTASVIRLPILRKGYMALGGLVFVLLVVTPYAREAVWLFLLSSMVLLMLPQVHGPYHTSQKEAILSRDFWMFIGALTLFLSALQISFSTSIPVINKLLEPMSPVFADLYEWTGWAFWSDLAKAQFAPPSDAIAHYNQWQVPFAFLVAMFIAIAQHMKYRNTPLRKWMLHILPPLVVSLAFTAIVSSALEMDTGRYAVNLLLFAASFACFSNLDYLFKILKGRISKGASSIAHVGFALVLLGALISTGESDKISANTSGVDIRQLNEQFNNAEDILLFKGDTLHMAPYFVRYKERRKEGINVYYEVEFFRERTRQYAVGDLVASGAKIYRCVQAHTASDSFFNDLPYWQVVEDPAFGQLKAAATWTASASGEYAFSLFPRIQLNPNFGNVAEPDTRHYFDQDIFTHVRWAELSDPEVDPDGYLDFKTKEMRDGDTLFTSRNMVVFKGLSAVRDKEKYYLLEDDVAAKAHLLIQSANGGRFSAEPLYIIRDSGLVVPDVAQLDTLGLKFAIDKIDPDRGTVSIAYAEHRDNRREFIVFQAILFPWINVLWVGCILMVLGTLLAVWQSIRQRVKSA